LTRKQAEARMKQVPEWELDTTGGEYKIRRVWRFKDFKGSMAFVNKVAELAEAHGHHPDIAVHYNEVTLTLWTHGIGGLSEHDVMIAAMIDQMII